MGRLACPGRSFPASARCSTVSGTASRTSIQQRARGSHESFPAYRAGDTEAHAAHDRHTVPLSHTRQRVGWQPRGDFSRLGVLASAQGGTVRHDGPRAHRQQVRSRARLLRHSLDLSRRQQHLFQLRDRRQEIAAALGIQFAQNVV